MTHPEDDQISLEDAEVEFDEKKANETADQLEQLSKDNPEYHNIYRAMLAAKRTYIFACNCLQQLLLALPDGYHKNELGAGFTRMVMMEANEPFDQNLLLDGLKKKVLPWLEKTATEHELQDQAQKQADIDARFVAHKAKVIPLEFSLEQPPLYPNKTMDKKKSLVFCGHERAVAYFLKRVVGLLTTPRKEVESYSVVYLHSSKMSTLPDSPYLLSRYADSWQGIAATSKGVLTYFQQHVASSLGMLTDLIVCDDLLGLSQIVVSEKGSAVIPEGYSFAAYKYNVAHKRLREVAVALGAGIIAGVGVNNCDVFEMQSKLHKEMGEWARIIPLLLVEPENSASGLYELSVEGFDFKLHITEEDLYNEVYLPPAQKIIIA